MEIRDVKAREAIELSMLIPRSSLCVVMAAAALATSTAAAASVICRWTDDNGRTQLAQVVPDQYKNVATCTDTQKYELSAAQKRLAQQRLDQERATARTAAAVPVAAPASGASRPAAAASQVRAKRPVDIATNTTDCPTWWRLYDESTQCFGPFKTTRGAIKAEAFDVCNVIASPEPKCGPRSH